MAHLRDAAVRVASAKTYADMRDASDSLGRGMQEVGLDNWSRFLVSASQQAQASGLEPRTVPQPPPQQTAAAPAASSARVQRIARLVKPGADATQADVDAVLAYVLAHIPDAVLDMMEEHGITIYVTRGSVARQLGSSPDTHARGPDDRNVGVVPAIYDKGRSRVIIATQDDGNGGRRMPDSREHGSVDAVLHEIGHGVDNRTSMWSDLSSRDDFTAPYKQDGQKGVFNLPYYHYENDGSAGRSELWAEAFAMYMTDPVKMRRDYPHLFVYFRNKFTREVK